VKSNRTRHVKLAKSLGGQLWNLITFAVFIRFRPDWNGNSESFIRFRNFCFDKKILKTDQNRLNVCGRTNSTGASVNELAIDGSTWEHFSCLKLNYIIHLCDVRTIQKVKKTCIHRMIVMWKVEIFGPLEPRKLNYTKVDFFHLNRPSRESRDSEQQTFSRSKMFLSIESVFSRSYRNFIDSIQKVQLARIWWVLTFTVSR
jgi:hypothetical protein